MGPIRSFFVSLWLAVKPAVKAEAEQLEEAAIAEAKVLAVAGEQALEQKLDQQGAALAAKLQPASPPAK